jgi:glycosyltransferase involved in cell wall biosynthesis
MTKDAHQKEVMAKPRLGIVLTEFGIPSEVWAIRQAEAFKHFEPVYFAQQQHTGGTPVPEGRELHLFGTAAPGIRRRIARKLGHRSGALPPDTLLNKIRTTLLEANLDAVLCHFAWNGISVLQAVESALPVICHVHGRDVTAYLHWPSNKKALAQALPGFAHIVAVGSHQVEIIRGLAPDVDASLIPCGAPISLFAKSPVPRRAPDEPLVFITVGRVSHEKGQLQTLTAFEATAREIPDTKLVVIGDGPAMEEVRKRVSESPVRNQVVLTGTLRPFEIAKALSKSHVFLQHSRSVNGWVEGFGVTLTEAGASGLPLIATSSGGIPDQVIDGQNGFLIQPDDIEAQTGAMLLLARDEILRLKMGQAARDIAEKFDSALMAQHLEQCICEVLG